jgi:hypothetical protein
MGDKLNYICKDTNEYIHRDTIELPGELDNDLEGYDEVEIELEEVDIDYEEPIDE